VVTLAWRNEQHGEAFVASLARAASKAANGTYKPGLILVVNGPEGAAAAERVVDTAALRGLKVAVVTLDENRGFSGGMNAGLAQATGEIVVLVNLDVTFDEGFFEVLETEILAQNWDLLAPLVVEGRGRSEHGVSRRTWSHRLSWIEAPRPNIGPVPAGNGACLILRRSAVHLRQDAIGGIFDGEYHSFNEDIDLFWWAERRGLAVRYAPDLRVTHALAGSFAGAHRFGVRPPDVQQTVMANYRLTVWKNARTLSEWLGWVAGEAEYSAQAFLARGPTGLQTYAASWPESVRKASAIRRRRGRLRAK
jgi:GT2 family glycosyltransferase